MKAKEKCRKRLAVALEWLYGILFAGVLFLVIFGAAGISYSYQPTFRYSNWLYLLLGASVWIGLRTAEQFCPEKVKKLFREKSSALILGAALFFFLVSVYLVYNYYFITGWDAGVLLDTVKGISAGQKFDCDSFVSYYFSTYPNNLFLIELFTGICHLEKLFGILDPDSCVMGILVVQCALSSLTGLLVYKIVYRWKNSVRMAWNGWILYGMVVGVSPWISIPYSDAMGIIFPVLTLYLFLSLKNRRFAGLKCFFTAVVSVIGYKIKPQLFIMTIAVIMGGGLLKTPPLLSSEEVKKEREKWMKKAAAVLAGGLTALAGVHLAISSVPIEVDQQEAFGPAHFMMMGLNPVTNGGYLEEDVLYSHEQPGEGRTKANLAMVGKRLEEYGPSGLAVHLAKKTLTNYSDGTWGWGQEGGFYKERKADKNQGISPFLKSVYYENGSRYAYFQNYSQMMWMMVLLGCFFAFLWKRRGRESDTEGLIMMLALVGLTAFELIFEARARYVYCYLPVCLILACDGWERGYRFILQLFRKRVKK